MIHKMTISASEKSRPIARTINLSALSIRPPLTDKKLPKKTVEAFFLRLPFTRIFTVNKKYKNDVGLEDAKGAELTRYPPGVQRSLIALKDLGTEIEDAPKSTSHLWLMNPVLESHFERNPETWEDQ